MGFLFTKQKACFYPISHWWWWWFPCKQKVHEKNTRLKEQNRIFLNIKYYICVKRIHDEDKKKAEKKLLETLVDGEKGVIAQKIQRTSVESNG